jgi:hypothetical protein
LWWQVEKHNLPYAKYVVVKREDQLRDGFYACWWVDQMQVNLTLRRICCDQKRINTTDVVLRDGRLKSTTCPTQNMM